MKNAGYTLIEILVTLTIVGILFGFGYASFRDFARRQQVAGITKQIQGDLRLAQQMALSGQKPVSGCSTLSGIRFRIDSAASYLLEYMCAGVAISPSIKNVNLSGVLFSSPLPSPIQFNVLGNGNSLGADELITLVQTGTNNTATVTVTKGGEIK